MCHTIDMPRSIRRAEDRFRRTTGAFIQPAEGGVISLSRRATSHDTDGRWVR